MKINNELQISTILYIALISLILFIGFEIYDGITTPDLITQSNVNLTLYQGKWYSIYELPNPFQKDCSCTTATYTLNPKDNSVEVLNVCGNTGYNISGLATSVNNSTSKLIIDFGFYRKGDYNIIYVDDNYSVALVGTDDRDYLWYLSRNKSISDSELKIMSWLATRQGFNVSQIKPVAQNCEN